MMKNKRAFDMANKEMKLDGLLVYGYRDMSFEAHFTNVQHWYCLGEGFFDKIPEKDMKTICKDIVFLAKEFGLEEEFIQDFDKDKNEYYGKSEYVEFDESYKQLPSFVFKLLLKMSEHINDFIGYHIQYSTLDEHKERLQIIFDLTSFLGMFMGCDMKSEFGHYPVDYQKLCFVDYYIIQDLKKDLDIYDVTLEDHISKDGEYRELLLFVTFDITYDEFINGIYELDVKDDFINDSLKDSFFNMFCDYFESYYGDLLEGDS